MQSPDNLSIVVLDNGHYGETRGQRRHSGPGVDLATVAAATGIGTRALPSRDGAWLKSRMRTHLGFSP